MKKTFTEATRLPSSGHEAATEDGVDDVLRGERGHGKHGQDHKGADERTKHA